MDQLKNLAGGSSNTTQQPAAGNVAAGGAQKEDYLDKGKLRLFSPKPLPPLETSTRTNTYTPRTAFDMGAKKSGHQFDRNTSEKITDGARGAFEKVTGKKVDPKISN